jgi:hypothetical protein
MDILTFFVGVIALCMVVITVCVIFIGSQMTRTLKDLGSLIDQTKQEVSTLSAKTSAAVSSIQAISSVANLVTLFFKRKN